MSFNDFLVSFNQRASATEYTEIKVTSDDINFLVRNDAQFGHKTLKKVYSLIGDQWEANKNGPWFISLPRYYDMSVAEATAIRNDQLQVAERAELIADIGKELSCSREEAEKLLGNADKWKTLSEPLETRIKLLIHVLNDNGLDTLAIRQITALMQNRGCPTWGYLDTLSMPNKFCERLKSYLETEQEGKPEETEVQFIEATPTGGTNTESTLSVLGDK